MSAASKLEPYDNAGEFVVYNVGIVYASVCTSLPVEQAEVRLNLEYPTGVGPWHFAEDEGFASGETNPCPCENAPITHRHLLFVC